MFARVTRITASPEMADAGDKMVNERIIPEARTLAGFQGGYWLLDRESGASLAVTLWDTMENLQASEATAARMRAEASEEIRGGEPTVEVFEVIGQA